MPFDVPSDISGGVGIPSVGELIRTGIGLGASYIESRFSAPSQGGFQTGGFMETQDDVPAISTGVAVSTTGNCGCGPARLPDFIPYSAGPQCGYDRLTTRTDRCGNTMQVWGKTRKRPRMNPGNMRAARRAGRRISSAIRHLKTLERALPHRTVTRKK